MNAAKTSPGSSLQDWVQFGVIVGALEGSWGIFPKGIGREPISESLSDPANTPQPRKLRIDQFCSADPSQPPPPHAPYLLPDPPPQTPC